MGHYIHQLHLQTGSDFEAFMAKNKQKQEFNRFSGTIVIMRLFTYKKPPSIVFYFLIMFSKIASLIYKNNILNMK